MISEQPLCLLRRATLVNFRSPPRWLQMISRKFYEYTNYIFLTRLIFWACIASTYYEVRSTVLCTLVILLTRRKDWVSITAALSLLLTRRFLLRWYTVNYLPIEKTMREELYLKSGWGRKSLNKKLLCTLHPQKMWAGKDLLISLRSITKSLCPPQSKN